MAGAVGKDGRDADGHVYGFLRGKGRSEAATPPQKSDLTPEEDGGGPMPAPDDAEG